jgi:hypothetical protein
MPPVLSRPMDDYNHSSHGEWVTTGYARSHHKARLSTRPRSPETRLARLGVFRPSSIPTGTTDLYLCVLAPPLGDPHPIDPPRQGGGRRGVPGPGLPRRAQPLRRRAQARHGQWIRCSFFGFFVLFYRPFTFPLSTGACANLYAYVGRGGDCKQCMSSGVKTPDRKKLESGCPCGGLSSDMGLLCLSHPQEWDVMNAVLHCNRAAAHMALRLFDKARDDCSHALRRKPDYWKAYLRRARWD